VVLPQRAIKLKKNKPNEPIAIQEQVTTVIKTFLTYVAVDLNPPPLDTLPDNEEAKTSARDEIAEQKLPLPTATTVDIFAAGHTKIEIRKVFFIEIIKELESGGSSDLSCSH
jgi:hypothetical protein